MGLLRTRSLAATLFLTWIVVMSLGCSTRLDRHWGESQRAWVAMQTANPNPEPVTSAERAIDGVTAEGAVETLRSESSREGIAPSIIQTGGGS